MWGNTMHENFLKKILGFIVQSQNETVRLRRDFCRFIRKIGKAGSLLDVGCADGVMTVEYSKILGVPEDCIHGIEVLETYIKKSCESIRISSINLEKDRFPYSEESFDVIVCNQVLEHLKNIFLLLSEMDRTLKSGGYLAIGIPNLAALHNRILLVLGVQPVCNAITGPHIRCFTHKAFLKFLKSNSNFRLIATAGSSLYPFPYPIVEFGTYLFPGLSAYTFYLLKKIKHNPQESTWRISSIGDTCL